MKGFLYKRSEIESYLLRFVYNIVNSETIIDTIFVKVSGTDKVTNNKSFNSVKINHITLTVNENKSYHISSIVISIDGMTETVKIPAASIIAIVLETMPKISFITAVLMFFNSIFSRKKNNKIE